MLTAVIIQTFLSANGQAASIAADSKDNLKTKASIVVTDNPTVLRRIAQYLEQVDVPPGRWMLDFRVYPLYLPRTGDSPRRV